MNNITECEECKKLMKIIEKLQEENKFLTYCLKQEVYYSAIKSHKINYNEKNAFNDDE